MEEFKCKPIEGMLSHQLQQHKIDGEKAIISNPNESQKYADYNSLIAAYAVIDGGDFSGIECAVYILLLFIMFIDSSCRKDHPKCEFDVHEVYALDILVSTGEGKAKERDVRTTVYKKADLIYQLKMKASRGTTYHLQ